MHVSLCGVPSATTSLRADLYLNPDTSLLYHFRALCQSWTLNVLCSDYWHWPESWQALYPSVKHAFSEWCVLWVFLAQLSPLCGICCSLRLSPNKNGNCVWNGKAATWVRRMEKWLDLHWDCFGVRIHIWRASSIEELPPRGEPSSPHQLLLLPPLHLL